MLAFAEVIKLLEEKRDTLNLAVEHGADSDISNFFSMLLDIIKKTDPIAHKIMEKTYQTIISMMPITKEKLTTIHDHYDDLIGFLKFREPWVEDFQPLKGQRWLLDKMKSVGYKIEEEGMCCGIQVMAMQAFLAEDMTAFNERLMEIYNLALEDCADNFSGLRKKGEALKSENPAEADKIAQLIVDALAFFDGISLNHFPKEYPEIFPDVVLQDTGRTIPFTLPSKLDADEKKPTNIASFTGAYDKNELTTYLVLLQRYLGDTSFSLDLTSGYGSANQGTHAISLNYNHNSNRWVLVDPSDLPGREYIHPELLSDQLFKSWKQEHRLAMLTEVYKTADNAATTSFKRLEEVPAWQLLHEISENKVNLVDDSNIGQAFYAAQSKNYSWLENAIKIGLKVDELNYKRIFTIAIYRNDLVLFELMMQLDCKPTPAMLNVAIQYDRIEMVQALINKGISVTEKMFDTAILGNSIHSINYLINNGVVIPKQAMLESALQYGKFDAASALVENGVIPTLYTLKSAIYSSSNKVKAIDFLTRNGVVPSAKLIEEAIRHKADIKVINALIENGGPVTTEMLHNAVEINSIELINMLISKGVKPTTGMLQSAIVISNIGVMNVLMGYGIKPTEKMLIWVIENNKTDALQYLLNHGMQPTESLLEIAISCHNVSAMAMLIDRGTQPTQKMLEAAIKSEDIDGCNLLIDAGVILTSEMLLPKRNGYFAFELLGDAIFGGRTNVIVTLLDLNVKPNQGMLETAVDRNQIEVIVLLKNRDLIPDSTALLEYARSHGANDILAILNGAETAKHSSGTHKEGVFDSGERVPTNTDTLDATENRAVPEACVTTILMKEKLRALLSNDENQDLSEKEAVNKFFENHTKLLTAKSKFGQSIFRKTDVQDNWSLKEILEHAMQSNNRSRRVCVALGWLDKVGQISEVAPQIIKDQFKQDLSPS